MNASVRAAVFCLSVSLAACPLPRDEPATPGSDKALTAFSIVSPAAAGLVDQAAATVTVTLPAGSAAGALVAAFTTTGVSVSVGGVPQCSGRTANDFTAPVDYVVSAADGSTARYRVTVTVARAPRGDKAITSFSLAAPPVTGVVDPVARAVSLAVPRGTDVTSLVAVFVITGTAVSVDDTEQASGVTVNDFTDPVTYLVTAEDGSLAAWTVTVRVLPGAEKSLTGFGFAGVDTASAWDQGARVIRVRVPPGTDRAALTAVFVTTGAAVLVDGVPQESGVTVNDFTRPVEYVVRAEDGSTETWCVRVTGSISLVVNELDVDQVGIDNAEFIELYAAAEVDCLGLVVALVNGGETPGQEYARIDLSPVGTLSPGTYLLVAGSRVSGAPGSQRLAPAGWESTNRIQNGPADAVVLWDTIGRRVVDAVSYNGALHRALLAGETGEVDAAEGAAGAPADSNAVSGSLGRVPSGSDTGQNGADFRFLPLPTPGAANQ
jgi:hypothetical protein